MHAEMEKQSAKKARTAPASRERGPGKRAPGGGRRSIRRLLHNRGGGAAM